ncbi:MAG: hypothetical protein JW944_03725 [Deltaproteobacteria bacterium]|nr:hypothetical protein [Deltaproteobacteria bacterium]
MEVATIILLGLILATLICMMLVFLGAIVNIQKNSESIETRLSGIQETINRLADRNLEITDNITNISNLSIDMKYHQKKLREQEMTAVIEKLNSIESNMNDLKTLFLQREHLKTFPL